MYRISPLLLSETISQNTVFSFISHSRLKGQADWPFTQTTDSARTEKNDPLRVTEKWFYCRKLPSQGTFEGHCGVQPIPMSIGYEHNHDWELT